jgi:hypothetical protein
MNLLIMQLAFPLGSHIFLWFLFSKSPQIMVIPSSDRPNFTLTKKRKVCGFAYDNLYLLR